MVAKEITREQFYEMFPPGKGILWMGLKREGWLPGRVIDRERRWGTVYIWFRLDMDGLSRAISWANRDRLLLAGEKGK